LAPPWSIQFSSLAHGSCSINMAYALTPSAIIDDDNTAGRAESTSILACVLRRLQGHGPGRTGAAQSVVLMAIVVVLTQIQFRYTEKKVNYCKHGPTPSLCTSAAPPREMLLFRSPAKPVLPRLLE
jgi:sn-glycerol 3-phosphate transport system permease protein